MPNWNQNCVEIHAPLDAVKAYLVPVEDNTYKFNMHLLFPEVVPSTDPTGDATWDYDWAVINTGSKRYPEIEITSREGAVPTLLDYDTARSPNDGTLKRLHELTGWAIINIYEEPGVGLE